MACDDQMYVDAAGAERTDTRAVRRDPRRCVMRQVERRAGEVDVRIGSSQ